MRRRLVMVVVAALAAAACAGPVQVSEPEPGGLAPPSGLPPGLEAVASVARCPPTDAELARCLRAELRRQAAVDGPEATVETLGRWRTVASPHGFPCHALGHFLGRELSVSVPADRFGDLVGTVDDNCRDGLLHGLFEGVGATVDPSDLAGELDARCSTLAPRDQCYHATGHAAAVAHRQDLDTALAVCGRLGDPSRCSAGVFMTFGGGSLTFSDDQDGFIQGGPEQPVVFTVEPERMGSLCASVDEIYRDGCWLYLWMFYTPSRNLGVDDYFAVCASAAGAERTACARGGGKVVVNNSDDLEDLGALVAGCPSAPLDVRSGCVYGVGLMAGGFRVAQDVSEPALPCEDLAAPDRVPCRDGHSAGASGLFEF
jgi:hypothetical protein